jgi:ferredoxin/flavodoxin
MKKCTICYFSGTGNTRFVSKRIKQHLSEFGYECELIPIEDITLKRRKIKAIDTGLLGIGFPIHAMDAPQIVYDFIDLLDIGKFEYFLFKTAGDPMFEGGSLLPITRKLSTLGGKCVQQSLFVMPPNMGRNRSKEAIKHMAVIADKQAQRVATKLAEGIINKEKDSLLSPLFGLFARLEKRGARQMSSSWTVSDECIHCGKCVRECPTRNISQQGRDITFSDKCILCLRCLMNCPVKAIRPVKAVRLFQIEPYDLEKIFADENISADYYRYSKAPMEAHLRKYFQNENLL